MSTFAVHDECGAALPVGKPRISQSTSGHGNDDVHAAVNICVSHANGIEVTTHHSSDVPACATASTTVTTQLPMRFIEIPRHRFSSVGSLTASSPPCLNVCSSLEAPCGTGSNAMYPPSPPSLASPQTAASTEPSCAAGPSVSTASIFRLEPRHRLTFGARPRTTSSGGSQGRKRSAQTMSCSKAGPSIGPLDSPSKETGHTVVSTPENQARPCLERRLSSPVAHAEFAFSMKGLSLQSPVVHADYMASPVCSPPQPPLGMPEGYAATPTSFAGNSSCFSKVVASPFTDTVESPYRRFRSPSMDATGDPGTSMGREFRSSVPTEQVASPRIVPLTVLSHASLLRTPSADSKIPPSSSSWLSTSAKNQRHEFLRHTTGAAGMSPFMRSLQSKSTPSTASSPGRMNDVETDVVHTPQYPPLPSVHLFYPDSASSMISFPSSMKSTIASPYGYTPRAEDDSPSKRSVWSRGSPHKKHFQLPKVALTPRSTASAGHVNTLPRFPSPTEDLQEASDASRPDAAIGRVTLPIRPTSHFADQPLDVVIPHVLDVSLLSEPDLNDTCSLDLSADASNNMPSSRGTVSSEFAPQTTLTESYIPFPSWGAYPPRSARPTARPEISSECPDGRHDVTGTAVLTSLQELKPPPDVTSMEHALVQRTTCSMFADDESLSDGEEDETFFLAVPSTLAEETLQSRRTTDKTLRQTKQPRLHFGSMTSMASATSLFGVNFAQSSTSLHGMVEQVHSSPNQGGGLVPAQRSLPSMRREQSTSSIGLDLELAVPTMDKNGFENGPAGRDLITPPVMSAAQSPPALSSWHMPIVDVKNNDKDGHECSNARKKAHTHTPGTSYEFTKQAVG